MAEGAPEHHLAAGRVVMVCTAAASRVGWARPDAWDAARFVRPARGEGGSAGSSGESSSDGEDAGEVLPWGIGRVTLGRLSHYLITQHL